MQWRYDEINKDEVMEREADVSGWGRWRTVD